MRLGDDGHGSVKTAHNNAKNRSLTVAAQKQRLRLSQTGAAR
jgi:hypothetical protein